MTDQQVCASTQKHNLDCWVRIMSSERVQNGVSLLGPDNESRKRPQNADKSVGTHSGCPPFVRRFVATFGFCFRVRVHEGSVCSNLFKYVTQTSRAAVSGSHLGQPPRACFSGMLLGQPSRAGISGKHLGASLSKNEHQAWARQTFLKKLQPRLGETAVFCSCSGPDAMAHSDYRH